MTPTPPNLADYLTFLYGVVALDPDNFPSVSGNASGGDAVTLVDASKTWQTGQWIGDVLVDVTQNETASIVANDTTSVLLGTAVSSPIVTGDAYLIVPPIVPLSLDVAMETVNRVLACGSVRLYTLAVYNLAADRLLNFAPDMAGQTYFADLRAKLRISSPIMGVIAMASDQGTVSSYLNPEQMKNFTLGDLQNLKTPYGRAYLEIAQSYGTLWGLS